MVRDTNDLLSGIRETNQTVEPIQRLFFLIRDPACAYILDFLSSHSPFSKKKICAWKHAGHIFVAENSTSVGNATNVGEASALVTYSIAVTKYLAEVT